MSERPDAEHAHEHAPVPTLEHADDHDLVAEHLRTRAALADTARAVVQLMRRAEEFGGRPALPGWSAHAVATHLATVFLAYCSTVPGNSADRLDWDALLPAAEIPSPERSFGRRMAAVNDRAIALLGEQVGADLAGFVGAHAERFLAGTESLPLDMLVATPWYGPRPALTVAAATGLLLSECLLHGLDIARATGLDWRIDPDHARLVLGQAMPTMMPIALDRERARGVELALELAVRGGPPLHLLFQDGELTVRRTPASRAPDCRLVADPVAFLLVAFRRTPQWRAIALGRLRAGGRRPWLALELTRLIPAP